jgi:hypothetical protein
MSRFGTGARGNASCTKNIKTTCAIAYPGSAGCQPAAFGSLPNAFSTAKTQNVPAFSRQAAANYRLAACAPPDMIATIQMKKKFTI